MSNLGTWARHVVGGRGDGDGYEGAPPNVRSDAFKDRPEVKAWIDANPRGYPRKDNPPAWVNDEATWDEAKKAVEPHWSTYSEPWAVVAHVYENMGGT